MYAVLDHVLKYGTYCLIGVFVLFGKTNLETGIQAIALSGNIYAAVKSAFEIYPRFVESSRAQNAWRSGRMQVSRAQRYPPAWKSNGAEFPFLTISQF